MRRPAETDQCMKWKQTPKAQLNLQVDKWTLISPSYECQDGLSSHSLHCVLFSFGSNIKFTHLSSPSSPSLKSAVERLLRPLPSLLWNKPQALKGVAPSLSKLRLNTVEWHSLALYTIIYPSVLFSSLKYRSCETDDRNSTWRRLLIFYYLSLRLMFGWCSCFDGLIWWQTVKWQIQTYLLNQLSHQSIVQFVNIWHY